ncbi:MAG: hypothetical protein ACTS3F_14335 [Phycisphaerales bacterium]
MVNHDRRERSGAGIGVRGVLVALGVLGVVVGGPVLGALRQGGAAGGGGAEARDGAARIVLVDPGVSPREPLRRAFEAGAVRSFSLEVVGESHQKFNGVDFPVRRMPGTVMTLRSEVLSVREDGSASVRFVIADAQVRDGAAGADGGDGGGEGGGGGERSAEAAVARADMAALKGAELTYRVSARGVLSDPGVILKGEQELSRSARLQLDQFQRTLEQIVVPLPEEAVGIGARWRVSTPIDLGAIRANRSVEYTLVDRLEGGRMELGFAITVSAPEQELEETNIPAGTELELLSLAGTGEGVGLLEGDAAVATRVSWRVAVDTEMDFTTPVPGEPERRTQKIEQLSITAVTATRVPTVEPGAESSGGVEGEGAGGGGGGNSGR